MWQWPLSQDSDYSTVAVKELEQQKYPSTRGLVTEAMVCPYKGNYAAKKKDGTELPALI